MLVCQSGKCAWLNTYRMLQPNHYKGITKCPIGFLFEDFGIGAAYGEGLYVNSPQKLVGTAEQDVST